MGSGGDIGMGGIWGKGEQIGGLGAESDLGVLDEKSLHQTDVDLQFGQLRMKTSSGSQRNVAPFSSKV